MTITESYQSVYNFHIECEDSFTKVKNEIISDTILTHYDPDLIFKIQLQMPDLWFGSFYYSLE